MNNAAIYREEILAHYRNPQNFGKLKNSDYTAQVINPLCGDELTLQLLFGRGGRLKTAKFRGAGCALSIASASVFTQYLKGKTRSSLKKISPAQTVKLLGIKAGLTRKKCVLLPHAALQKIIQSLS